MQRQLRRLGRSALIERLQAIRALSAVRGLRYIDEQHRTRTIDVASVPWLLTVEQLSLFRRIAHDIMEALLLLPRLYAEHSTVRDVLRLDERQDAWMRLAAHPRSAPWAVMGRLDSTATYDRSDWASSFELLEPNAVGVGGVHYAPAACSVIWDALGDALQAAFPGRRIAPTPDPRTMLTEEFAGLCRRGRRRLRRVALIENMDFTTGTDEFASLASHLISQGLETLVVDPREVEVSGGRLTARGQEIDLVYRDCELSEFVQMERRGRPLRGMRAAVREGWLVSGLLWEFDHKACWEILTDPAYARYFTPRQRRLFRDHLPWTRLVRHGVTYDPDGVPTELPEYIRRHRDELVLKPNMLYGGQGVLIGPVTTQREWEQALERAITDGEPYVVQRLAKIGVHPFPIIDHGAVRQVQRRVVSGFFFTSSQIGLVGRFSDDPVVNVSRGGGLVAAFIVE